MNFINCRYSIHNDCCIAHNFQCQDSSKLQWSSTKCQCNIFTRFDHCSYKRIVEFATQVFEIDTGDLPEPSNTAAGSENLVEVSSGPSKFISLKLLFFDGVFVFGISFSFCFPLPFSFLLPASFSDCCSPLGSGNNGGSWPLSRQNTRSTVSLISFPRPLLSTIKSQTDFEAFSSTEALHEINIDVRKIQTTREPSSRSIYFNKKIYNDNHEDTILLGIMISKNVRILPRPTWTSTTKHNRYSGIRG